MEDEPIFRIEKALRKKQSKCMHPSFRCTLCNLYKDNLVLRDQYIQDCIDVIYANRHLTSRELICLLGGIKRLNKFYGSSLTDEPF